MRIKTKILLGALFLSTSVSAYDWESDLQHRLQYDFTESRESVVDYIRRYIPHVTEEKIAQWETSGALENMEIDGQKRYFRYAARNLFRIDPSCQRIWDKANPSSTFMTSTVSEETFLPIIDVFVVTSPPPSNISIQRA